MQEVIEHLAATSAELVGYRVSSLPVELHGVLEEVRQDELLLLLLSLLLRPDSVHGNRWSFVRRRSS